MQEPPIVFTGHRVFEAFAKETSVVSFFQIIEREWVAPIFFVKKSNRVGVFLASMNQFFFSFTPDLLRDTGSFNGESQHHQSQEEHDRKQDITALRTRSVRILSWNCRLTHWDLQPSAGCFAGYYSARLRQPRRYW